MNIKISEISTKDNLELYREQLKLYQEYYSVTKDMLILCEQKDFAEEEPLEQLMTLISKRQGLVEEIERVNVTFPASIADNANSLEKETQNLKASGHDTNFPTPQIILEKTLEVLKELSSLNQKVQELLEKKSIHLKEQMNSSRMNLKAHNTYYPQGKQHEGVFVESLVGDK